MPVTARLISARGTVVCSMLGMSIIAAEIINLLQLPYLRPYPNIGHIILKQET